MTYLRDVGSMTSPAPVVVWVAVKLPCQKPSALEGEAAPQPFTHAFAGQPDEYGRIALKGDGSAKGAFYAVSNHVAVATTAQGRPACRAESFSMREATLPSASRSSGPPL